MVPCGKYVVPCRNKSKGPIIKAWELAVLSFTVALLCDKEPLSIRQGPLSLGEGGPHKVLLSGPLLV